MPGNGQHEFVPTCQQQEAIEHVHGPMLVVAGAGTGKTTVLARRIAHLINSGAARPDEILAVTYTRNSAAELVSRVAEILHPGLESRAAAAKLMSSGLQANTFHAYCFGLLSDASIKFELIDDIDQFVYLRRRVASLKLKYFIESANLGRFLKDLLTFFKRCQDELRTPDDYTAYVESVALRKVPLPRVEKSKTALTDEDVVGRCREIARVYRQLEEMLQQDGLGTFGHIIARAVDLLSRRQSVLLRAQKRARFVLIDEFQDSNVAQIKLARLLGGEAANVFAVGDPDQGIYRFRGASSEAFDQFLATFGVERVKRVTMSANRRSTPTILSCAYEAIRCNPEVGSTKLEGGGWEREPLSCARLELEDDPQLAQASPVQCVAYTDHEQEAEFIADSIEAMRRERPGMKLSDIAVLYAQHRNRDTLLGELRRRGIPVQVKGANLLETPEVRDAMAVLQVLDSTNLIALLRVAALTKFEVDPRHFRAELALADRNASGEPELEKAAGGREVVQAIRMARRELANANGALEAAMKIALSAFELPDSAPLCCLQRFAGMWLAKPTAIAGKQTLHEFLEYMEYFRDADGHLSEDSEDAVSALAPKDLGAEPENAVQLMTIHAAKGLEFPCVFVMRINSRSLPSDYRPPLVEFPKQLRAYDSVVEDDPKKLHAEEQRRMFYVAMTRAMDELYLYGKAGREKRQPAPPSGYLRELADLAKGPLRGALESHILPPTIRQIHAAAAPLPRVLQWVQLEPRQNGRMDQLSASAIDSYDRCPLAFKLKRDWTIPEDPHASMQYGQAMHLALKAYFDGVRAGRPPGEEDVIACFLDEFAKTSIAEDEQRRRYEQDGREQLTSFLRSPNAQPAGAIHENESNVAIVVGGMTVRGRIDRIDCIAGNRVRIVDYKTGRAKSQEDADESLQLSIYALAAKQDGLDPVSLAFVNLKDGTVAETSRGAGDLLEAETKVMEVARKIAAGEFDPKTGPHCKNCSYVSICPEQELLTITPVTPDTAKVN